MLWSLLDDETRRWDFICLGSLRSCEFHTCANWRLKEFACWADIRLLAASCLNHGAHYLISDSLVIIDLRDQIVWRVDVFQIMWQAFMAHCSCGLRYTLYLLQFSLTFSPQTCFWLLSADLAPWPLLALSLAHLLVVHEKFRHFRYDTAILLISFILQFGTGSRMVSNWLPRLCQI